jgi:5-methylcytosine-specific restriction enzyme subunit McrC
VIELNAWDTVDVELPGSHAVALGATGLVTATPLESSSRWRLAASSMVGVAVGKGWELRVSPRIDIAQLMFLLSYARADGWGDSTAGFAAENDVFAAVANGFAARAEEAILPAPLSGYVTIDETTSVFRGQLRVGDQLAQRPAMPLPLEVSYDDYSPDIVENRLLRGAAELLLRLPLVSPSARSRLLRIRALLDRVRPQPPAHSISLPVITRLNLRYANALPLARLILQSAGVSTARGNRTSSTFSFDMNAVFEDFLTRSLADAVRSRGAQLVAQHDRRHLDQERRLQLKPDITLWRGGRCVAVIDAKYKPLTTPGFPNADAYQMLAYCTAYGLHRGTLVYAKDALGDRRRHTIDAADVTIDVKALDVARPHGEVLAQVDALANDIIGRVQGRHEPSAGVFSRPRVHRDARDIVTLENVTSKS